jgi:hypothetical protein
MAGSFLLAVVLYAFALGGVCLVTAVGGRTRPPTVSVSLGLLQGVVVIAGLLDAVALIQGEHRSDVATNLGYLFVSVLVLPATFAAVRADAGRWGNAAGAVACVLLAVISLRLHVTLGPAAA